MDTKQLVSRDQEIIFTNWADEDFEGTWDKRIYKFAAKKSYYVPFYLAEHFAQKLITRELNEESKNQFDAELKKNPMMEFETQKKVRERIDQTLFGNLLKKQEMLDKCVTIIPMEPQDINIVRPKEVPMKEVVLHRDERAAMLKEKFPGIDVQVNQKALNQKEDEFEPPAE